MKFSKATGIRAGRVPERNSSLSGVVVVDTAQGRKLAFIRFEDELVRRVGMEMPQGIGPGNPAYLQVKQVGKRWKVLGKYLGMERGALLAVLDEKPGWLKEHDIEKTPPLRRAGKGGKGRWDT